MTINCTVKLSSKRPRKARRESNDVADDRTPSTLEGSSSTRRQRSPFPQGQDRLPFGNTASPCSSGSSGSRSVCQSLLCRRTDMCSAWPLFPGASELICCCDTDMNISYLKINKKWAPFRLRCWCIEIRHISDMPSWSAISFQCSWQVGTELGVHGARIKLYEPE